MADGQPEVLVSNVTTGTTYYIAVDGYLGASGAAVLNVFLNPTNSVNTNVPPITNKLVVLTVKSPINNQPTTSSNFGINGTVQGGGGHGLGQTTIDITVNSNAPVPAVLGAAARVTSWSLTNIALLPGANVITAEAYSMNGDGTTNASLPVARNVYLVPTLPVAADKSAITLLTSGNGHIAGVANNASLELNKVYTATAVPSANWVFTNWSSGTNTNSLATLEPNTAALPFVMSANLILQANFVTNPFVAMAGVYNGLFSPIAGAAEVSSGFFTATISPSSKGAFTGKLLLNGGSYPFSGAFDLTGNSGLTVARAGSSYVILELQMNLAAQDDQITGNIIEGANPGWFSTVVANRSDFNSRTNPATNYNGNFTLVIPPGDGAPTNSPGGYGYATLINSTAGQAVVAGKLGDGTSFSQSVPISKEGYIPLYASLYSREGSVQGWLQVTNNPSNSPGQTILGTNLAWIRTSSKSRSLYASGFTNANITVLGSVYSGAKSLPSTTNYTLTFSNGHLSTAVTYSNVTFENGTLVKTPANADLTGEISRSTGVLTLSFRPPGANHNTTATGVILQDSTETNAAGWFLGTEQSGFFLLEP